MGGRWPYSCCFVGCCFQHLFNMTCGILVQFRLTFSLYALSVSLWCIHIVELTRSQLGENYVFFLRRSSCKNLEATFLFIDFSKAFVSIQRGKMEQILLAYGLPKETVAAIMIFHKNTKVNDCSSDGDRLWFLSFFV